MSTFAVCCGMFALVVIGQVAANGLFRFISDLLSDSSHPTNLSWGWGVLTFCLLSIFEVAEASVTLFCNFCHTPRRKPRLMKTMWLSRVSHLDSGSVCDPGCDRDSWSLLPPYAEANTAGHPCLWF